MRKNRFITGCLLAFLTLTIFTVMGSKSAFAISVTDTMRDKMLYQALYKCYITGHVSSAISPLSQYRIDNLATGDNQSLVMATANDIGFATCDSLFSYSGNVFAYLGSDVVYASRAGTDKVDTFLKSVGYDVDEAKSCYRLSYRRGGASYYTNRVCESAGGEMYVGQDGDERFFEIRDNNLCFTAGKQKCVSNGDLKNGAILTELVKASCDEESLRCNRDDGIYYFNTIVSYVPSGEAILKSDHSVAGLDAVNHLSTGSKVSVKDVKTLEEIKIGNNELSKRLLYESYLLSYYGVNPSPEKKSNYTEEITWYVDGSVKTYYYDPDEVKKAESKGMVNGIDDSSGFFEKNSLSVYSLIEAINSLPTEYTEDFRVKEEENEENSSENEENSSIKEMCDKAELNGQGWMLCPALANTTYAASGIDNLIQDWLSIDTSLYDFNSDTYAVWQIMRGIANIIIILMLLVIIVSQITGYGIDNYGIKKMLPRLVVMAVLVNLSFVICMVAVDASNITGIGLRDMFGTIGNALELGKEFNGLDFISGIVASILSVATGAGMAGGTIATVATIWAAPNMIMIVIIIMLAVLSILAAVILFFLTLGARMILVILCISVAPVAFALYILPNTQSLFKRWLDVFKAVLVVFPLCGALGGISALVKGMVRGVEITIPNIAMMVIALVAPFLVFFFLPTLLRNALSSIGQIGSAFQSLGQRLTGGIKEAQGVVQSSEIYKDAMEEATANRAEGKVKKYEGMMKNKQNLTRRQLKDYNSASRTLANRNGLIRQGYANTFERQDVKDVSTSLKKAIENGNENAAIAAIQDLHSKGADYDLLTSLSSASWEGTNEDFRRHVGNAMATTGLEACKGYAGNTRVGFDEWVDTGYVSSLTGDDGKFREDALSGFDHKQLQHLSEVMGRQDPKSDIGNMLTKAALQFRGDSKAMPHINKMISKQGIQPGQLKLNPDQLASMRLDTLQAIDGSNNGAMREAYGQSIAEAVGRDPKLYNAMTEEVRSYWGISDGQKAVGGGDIAHSGIVQGNEQDVIQEANNIRNQSHGSSASSSSLLDGNGKPLPPSGKTIGLK